jgi:hypothetical protein
MKKVNPFLLLTIILILLSIGSWSIYQLRINQASEYEEEIMETRGLFRYQAQLWIKKHEPEIYNNPYDIIAISCSFVGVLTLISYVVTITYKKQESFTT